MVVIHSNYYCFSVAYSRHALISHSSGSNDCRIQNNEHVLLQMTVNKLKCA